MRFILFLCLSVSFGQCSSSKNKSSVVAEAPSVEIEEQKDTELSSLSEDCYPGRNKIKTITDQTATVATIVGEKMLVFDYTRLHPCKLPEDFAKDDLKVVVSGDTYDTPPNVRVAGLPFIIRSIKLME